MSQLETWQLVALAGVGYLVWRRYGQGDSGAALASTAPASYAGGGGGDGVAPGGSGAGGVTGYLRPARKSGGDLIEAKRAVGATMAGTETPAPTAAKPLGPVPTPGFGDARPTPAPLAPLVKNAVTPVLKSTGLAGFAPRAPKPLAALPLKPAFATAPVVARMPTPIVSKPLAPKKKPGFLASISRK